MKDFFDPATDITEYENWLQTASIADIITSFKEASVKAIKSLELISNTLKNTIIKVSVNAAKVFKVGIRRFFVRRNGMVTAIHQSLSPATIWLNTEKPDGRTLAILQDLDDQLGMEEVLFEALEILNK
jgi:hypothetical protein